MKKYKENKGITLIALVVSIIVLLILAGISINMLTGQNGILNRTREAKEKTLSAQQEENSILTSYEEQISSYAGIDWKMAMANAKAPEEQKEEQNNGVIGIGTDGKPVNMDLWEYTKLDDGTYGLNDSESLTDAGTKTTGYIGKIIDGKIEGSVPTYIKGKNDSEFFKVTNMAYTFFNNKELQESPKIPDEVTNIRALFNSCENLTKVYNLPQKAINMFGTFANCKKIKNIPEIPNSVINMGGTFLGCEDMVKAPAIPSKVQTLNITFQGCINLEKAPEIPNSVTNMYGTFSGCTKLSNAPEIPNSVTNMYGTFLDCVNLLKAPSIPNSVTILCATFKGCSKLQGEIEINASVTGVQLGGEYSNNIDYNNCLLNACTEGSLTLKVTGTCAVIDKIIENASNPNITKK